MEGHLRGHHRPVVGDSGFRRGAPAWPDIKVEVKADQPVTTTQSLKEQADGFQRLAITLSNQGQAAADD